MTKILVAVFIVLVSFSNSQAPSQQTSGPPSPPRVHTLSSTSGAIPQRVMQGDTMQLNVRASDPQGSLLQYRLVVDGRQVLPFGRANILRWAPDSAQAGRKQLLIEVKNSSHTVASQAMEIFVLRRPKAQPAISGGSL